MRFRFGLMIVALLLIFNATTAEASAGGATAVNFMTINQAVKRQQEDARRNEAQAQKEPEIKVIPTPEQERRNRNIAIAVTLLMIAMVILFWSL